MLKNDKMTKNKKQIILITISVIAIIGTIIFGIKIIKDKPKNEEFKIDGIDIIKKDNLLKDTKVDSLDITNQVLYNINEMTTYSAIIENNTDSDFYVKELYINLNIGEEEKKILIVKNETVKSKDKKDLSKQIECTC